MVCQSGGSGSGTGGWTAGRMPWCSLGENIVRKQLQARNLLKARTVAQFLQASGSELFLPSGSVQLVQSVGLSCQIYLTSADGEGSGLTDWFGRR